MKTVGIIGGLSPESTISYYKGLTQGVQLRLGGHHGGHIFINSLDFGEFVKLKEAGDWSAQAKLLCEAAQDLEKAGADFLILATNTMHKMADQIIKSVNIPFLHLADATAAKIKADKVETVGLLGTRYTMEEDFYKGRLQTHGLKTLIPDASGIENVNKIIYDELCKGIILDESRKKYQNVIRAMQKQGAQGVILGCTEIGMLIEQQDCNVKVYDTTAIHIEAALEKIFEDD